MLNDAIAHARPTVSVVIPAFNAARFIVRALASIEAQSWKPDDVHVVDDGSADATARLAADFANHASFPIHVLRQANRGSANARNAGIRHSHGDLIVFMDADDAIYPDFIRLTTAALRRHARWVACFSDRDVVDNDGVRLAGDLAHPGFRALRTTNLGEGCIELSDDRLFARLVRGSVIPMTMVCRRSAVEAVGNFDESIRFHEDRLFILKLVKHGSLGYVDQALGIWQRHDHNKTGEDNALAGCASSDLILQKLLDLQHELRLTAPELAEITRAQRDLASDWMYAASHERSPTTIPLAWHLLRQHRIGIGRSMKSILFYLAASIV